jgi:hypothetical protein
MDEDDMDPEEPERRLDDLRDRVNLSARAQREGLMTTKRKLMALRRICYVVAAIVFIVALFILVFVEHLMETSILGLFCAAVVFCIAIVAVVWAITGFWAR